MSDTCRYCGHHATELPTGSFLARVNEKGVPGIWECRPKCPDTEVFHVVSGRFTSTEPNFRDIPRATGVTVIVLEAEPNQQCDLCGKIAELRPYGPNGECICFECGMKDEETTKLAFYKRLGLNSGENKP